MSFVVVIRNVPVVRSFASGVGIDDANVHGANHVRGLTVFGSAWSGSRARPLPAEFQLIAFLHSLAFEHLDFKRGGLRLGDRGGQPDANQGAVTDAGGRRTLLRWRR